MNISDDDNKDTGVAITTATTNGQSTSVKIK